MARPTDAEGTSPQTWTWRNRARDPRYAGLLVLAFGVGAGCIMLGRKDLAASVPAACFAVVAGAGVGLLSLPPWRDLRHGPWAGALILAGGGVVALAMCAALSYGAGVSW